MRKSPLIKEFLDYLRIEKGLATNTIQSYALDLNRLQAWTSKSNLSIRALTERDIERWIGSLSRNNLNTASIGRALSTTRGFFQFLILDGHIKDDPTEKLAAPKKTRPLPQVLTSQEVRKLLDAPDTNTTAGLRDRALLELLYATGLRISEAISLRHQDLDLPSRILRCYGKGNKERQVPIAQTALPFIEQYIRRIHALRRPPKAAYLFLNQGQQLTRQLAWALISHYAAKARLANVTPHTLRHTFATQLLENGASTVFVQRLLGHQDISTTAIYLCVSKRHLRASYDQHHPRARA